MANLVNAQSDIIENLSKRVSSVTERTDNKQKFKKVLIRIARHSRLINSVTKQLKETVKQVKALAGEWSDAKTRMNKELEDLEKSRDANKEGIEENVKKKIEKLQQEMKTLRVSLQYAEERSCVTKKGNFLFLCNFKIVAKFVLSSSTFSNHIHPGFICLFWFGFALIFPLQGPR